MLNKLVQMLIESSESIVKRDLKQVRKTLAKRKKGKTKAVKVKYPNRPPRSLDTLKQQHTNHSNDRMPLFMKQLIISGSFFLIATLIFQTQLPALSQTKQWLTKQLSEDFPFATVNVWYQERFGLPFGLFVDQSTIPTYGQLAMPVNGVVSESFETNGQGLVIEVIDQPDVYAIEQGTVIFAGNDRQTKKTIIIQHPDRTKSIYGFLDEINVTPYQFVHASQMIGTVSTLLNGQHHLYFSMQKGSEFIDPIEVIPVDDTK